MGNLFLKFIRFYQKKISPFLPARCRYYPTCSDYMAQAVKKYGIAKGFFLGFLRLLRCNPLFPGGYDPVP
ncbi:MAG: membrane protein insertion efficiency factor YidD [Oscillospiraceae bacterium]|nr:membrane protein insertion efficiency factor YidD [Oscillospiraceae bacterium]